MKKKLVFFIATFLIIVSFQNCGQAPQISNSESSESKTSTDGSYNKYSTEGVESLVMWDFQRQQFLDLNLNSGKVLPFEQYGSEVAKATEQVDKCASPEDLQRLQQILQESIICEPVVQADQLKDKVCTMVYEYPYASLVGGGDEVKLGERTSGCDQPVDLCGDKATLLKQFVTSFIQNLDSKNCQ